MIRFESCDASTSRYAANETKALARVVAPPDASETVTAPEGLFADEGGEAEESQGPGGKKPRGRSRKFRS